MYTALNANIRRHPPCAESTSDTRLSSKITREWRSGDFYVIIACGNNIGDFVIKCRERTDVGTSNDDKECLRRSSHPQPQLLIYSRITDLRAGWLLIARRRHHMFTYGRYDVLTPVPSTFSIRKSCNLASAHCTKRRII